MMITAAFDLPTWASARLLPVEARLAGVFADAWPARLAEACAYPLQTGGKRIRPLLVLAAAEAVSGLVGEAVPGAVDAACAIELVHTYSLVHDDLPCMDDDDLRRGRPTVHRAYGENVAVLVGDALLTEAFVLAGSVPARDVVGTLARAAGARGMISGQGVDIGLDGPVTTLDALVRLHRAKTGALLRASVRLGGLCAGADDATLAALDTFGDAIGLAFQVHDDLLDADQDEGEEGPPSFVKLLGRDGTAAAAARYAEDAERAVAPFADARALRALARFSVERTS